MLFKVLLGICSIILVFAKNIGDPYYEPTDVVHDIPHPSHQQIVRR